MRRSVKYGLIGGIAAGAVAATVAGVTVAASADAKLVTVNVDGSPITVKTSAQHVGDVLKQAGYTVSAHDLVAPAVYADVHSGSTIVLKRGRELHLQVDGSNKDVWTTASTVDEALSQLGYSQKDFVSVSRANRLAVGATAIAVRTPKSVLLTADGDKKAVTTTAATVRDVLDELGVELTADDVVTPALSTEVTQTTKITVTRVKKGHLVVAEDVPFAVTQRPSASLTVGETKVLREGVPGSAKVVYVVTYHNGTIVKRTKIKRMVTAQPVDQIEQVGTKPAPAEKAAAAPAAETPAAPSSAAPGPAPAPTSIATPAQAQQIAWTLIQARGWGRNQFNCLAQIWGHESGWRVTAGSPYGTYGIPQANPGSKMASAGPGWQTDARTQIEWGLAYITAKYGTPCGAWNAWQNQGGWY